jgi:hypothetical protein
MKFLTLSFFLLPFAACCQFTKADKLLGGTMNFRSQNYPIDAGQGYVVHGDFSIAPQFGYFLNESLAIGVVTGFNNNYDKYHTINYNSDAKSHGYDLSLFTRKYFTISDNFFFAVNGSAGFSQSKSTVTNTNTSNNESKSYSANVDLRPMLVFFPSRNWGIEGGIGSINYSHGKTHGNERSSNYFNASLGGIYFGIAYYFRK